MYLELFFISLQFLYSSIVVDIILSFKLQNSIILSFKLQNSSLKIILCFGPLHTLCLWELKINSCWFRGGGGWWVGGEWLSLFKLLWLMGCSSLSLSCLHLSFNMHCLTLGGLYFFEFSLLFSLCYWFLLSIWLLTKLEKREDNLASYLGTTIRSLFFSLHFCVNLWFLWLHGWVQSLYTRYFKDWIALKFNETVVGSV